MVESVIAGDSAEWMLRTAERFRCVPADAAVKAFLRINGSLTELAAERKDGLILIQLKPSVSEALQPGEAVLIVRLETAGGEYRRSEVIGKLLVKPGIEKGDFEHRTEAQICLDQAKGRWRTTRRDVPGCAVTRSGRDPSRLTALRN